MHSPYRKYVTGEELASFRAGLFEALGGEARADVVRLSSRKVNRRETICVLIGVPGKPAGKMFETAVVPPQQAAGWVQLGLDFGRSAVTPWLDPESQLRTQEEAMLAGRDVWSTHEIEDLSQDAVDEWEATWRAHLHGKLHAVAKADLIRAFSAAMMALLAEKAGTAKPDRMAKVRAARGKKKEEVVEAVSGDS